MENGHKKDLIRSLKHANVQIIHGLNMCQCLVFSSYIYLLFSRILARRYGNVPAVCKLLISVHGRWCRGAVWLPASIESSDSVCTQKYPRRKRNKKRCMSTEPAIPESTCRPVFFFVSVFQQFLKQSYDCMFFLALWSLLSSFLTTPPAVATKNGVRSTSGW